MRDWLRPWLNLSLRALLLAASLWSGGARADGIARVEVVGTDFRVTLESGRVLAGPDLAGAKITVQMAEGSPPQQIRIDRVVADPTDRTGEMLLYHMLLIDPAGAGERELCEPDPQGERWAFPVRGHWDAEGQYVSDAGFTLTCSGDAQGKCVRFGYKPWKALPDGTSLAPYHQACVRLVRADYCGGHGTTRNGMLIDIYDRIGIQPPADPKATPDLSFEAAWTPKGAVCVAHTRVPENMTLEGLAASCPRLRGRLGPAVCMPEAVLDGRFGQVLLFNRSR
jgi:hypothetical protein